MIKKMNYDRYIAPLLTNKPEADKMMYLYDEGWDAFTSNISKSQIDVLTMLQGLYEETYAEKPDEFLKVIASVYDNSFDAHERHSARMGLSIDSNGEDDIKKSAILLMDEYKLLFESEFRLWSTPLYFHIKNKFGRPGSVVEWVGVSGSDKYQEFKNNTELAGFCKEVILGFDNEIRNAGSGHESWDINDENKIVLNVINPKTGAKKYVDGLVFSLDELREEIGNCYRTLWALRVSLPIFLINHPDIAEKLNTKSTYKKEEILKIATFYANSYWMEIDWLDLGGDEISISISYKPKTVKEGAKLFSSDGSAYDIINFPFRVSYLNNILGIIQRVIMLLNLDIVKTLHLVFSDKVNKVEADLVIPVVELIKLIDTSEVPKPSKGSFPEGDYEMVAEVPMEYGFSDFFNSLTDSEKQIIRDKVINKSI